MNIDLVNEMVLRLFKREDSPKDIIGERFLIQVVY